MALGVLGVILFGFNLPANRMAVAELDPVFVTGGRAVLAALVAAAALAYQRRPIPAPHQWPRLAAYAVGVVVGFPLFVALAMKWAPASHGGVVLAVMPLITAIAGAVVAGERPSVGFWACGVAGTTAVLAYALISGAGATGVNYADLLLAAGAISASCGYAIGGDLSRTMPGWEVICWAVILSAPPLLILCLTADVNWHASAWSWFGFVYTALGSMLFGLYVWNRGLALGGIAKVGQLQLLQPFITLLASYAVLGERIGWLEYVFSVLVVGIVLMGARMRVRQTRGGQT